MTVFVIGEVLVDRFPDRDRAGGAPFNVACHLKQFGAPVRLISRIGIDAPGKWIARLVSERGLSAVDIQTDPHHATGTVDVTVDAAGGAAFAIREDVAYDHIVLDRLARDPAWKKAQFIYFGSLIQRGELGFRRMSALLAQKPAGTTCFCDVNLRPPHYSRATVIQCLYLADVFKLNEAELEEIRRLLERPVKPEAFPAYLMDRYDIAMVAVTRGSDGSTIFHHGGRIDAPMPPDVAVADSVGAGDGYSAALIWGMLRNWPLARTVAMAGAFSAEICRIPGAIPEDLGFYDPWRSDLAAP